MNSKPVDLAKLKTSLGTVPVLDMRNLFDLKKVSDRRH
jgi:hypothetical protein